MNPIEETRRFPLLADGVSELIRNRWTSHGRQLLEQFVVSSDSIAERIIAGIFVEPEDHIDVLHETKEIVISKGSTASLRGLARGAQNLFEAGHTKLASEVHTAIFEMLRERQRDNTCPETAKFLVEISNEQGRILIREGKRQEATLHFRNTLEDALEVKDKVLIGTVTNNLASCLLVQESRTAELNQDIQDLLLDNERRLSNCNDGHRQLAVTFHNLGRLYYSSDSNRAEEFFRKDVDVCQGMNDLQALADAWNTLGVFRSGRSQFADADAAHQEELDLFERILDPPRQARALAASGANCLSQGYHADDQNALVRAQVELSRSLEIYRRLDRKLPEEHATAMENLGRTHFLLGDRIRGKELMLDSANMHDNRSGGQQIASRIREELNALN